jgi:hypothetical protein
VLWRAEDHQVRPEQHLHPTQVPAAHALERRWGARLPPDAPGAVLLLARFGVRKPAPPRRRRPARAPPLRHLQRLPRPRVRPALRLAWPRPLRPPAMRRTRGHSRATRLPAPAPPRADAALRARADAALCVTAVHAGKVLAGLLRGAAREGRAHQPTVDPLLQLPHVQQRPGAQLPPCALPPLPLPRRRQRLLRPPGPSSALCAGTAFAGTAARARTRGEVPAPVREGLARGRGARAHRVGP